MILLKMYLNVIVFVVFICLYEGIKINVIVIKLFSLNFVEFISYLNFCIFLLDLRIKGFDLKIIRFGVLFYILIIWIFFF